MNQRKTLVTGRCGPDASYDFEMVRAGDYVHCYWPDGEFNAQPIQPHQSAQQVAELWAEELCGA